MEKIAQEGFFMTEKEYGKLIKNIEPKSPIGKDCLNAFWIGGLICCIGQLCMNGYTALGLDKTGAGTATCITLITLSAFLTGLSLYDDIAKHAGAGTLVPITGFANFPDCRSGYCLWCFCKCSVWTDLLDNYAVLM